MILCRFAVVNRFATIFCSMVERAKLHRGFLSSVPIDDEPKILCGIWFRRDARNIFQRYEFESEFPFCALAILQQQFRSIVSIQVHPSPMLNVLYCRRDGELR